MEKNYLGFVKNILWSEISVYLFDLDGCVYMDNEPTQGAVELVNYLHNKKKTIFFITNNSTDSLEKLSERLHEISLPIKPSEIISSASIAGEYIMENFGKSRIFLLGMEALKNYLIQSGHSIVNHDDDNCEIVLVGRDLQFNYKKLQKGIIYLENGARLVATNLDNFHPGKNGRKNIETGALVAAIQKVINAKPCVIGKPGPYIFKTVLTRLGINPDKAVMVGDNPYTDIVGGKNAGVQTVLIKSSVNQGINNILPDFYCKNLIDFLTILKTKKRGG